MKPEINYKLSVKRILMSEKIQKRIFLVGAARSGTTLLQSLLSAHSQIYSFPETHFFSKTIPMRRSKQQLWRFKKKNVNLVKQFMEETKTADSETLLATINPRTVILKDWIGSLLKILDEITLQKGYSIWLEKTPSHLRYVNLLEKTDPDINYIHIIRQGEDVIASLYEVTRKHSDKWGGERTLDNCIGRWKRDFIISSKYLGKTNHSFVLYEEFVKNPESIIKHLCEKLQLPFEERMLEEYKDEASKIISKDEEWKENVSKEIGKRSKFNMIFSKEEQEYVKSKIEDTDASIFSLITN